MATNLPSAAGSSTPDPQAVAAEQRVRLQNQFRSGANWFIWIAALSLVNSISALAGSTWGFIIGLGLTQVIDAVARAAEAGVVGKTVAFGFDLAVATVFVLFGLFARKRSKAAFVSGMVIYALDGLIFLGVRDFLSFGFHVFALYCIYVGLKACKRLLAAESEEKAAAAVVSSAPINPA